MRFFGSGDRKISGTPSKLRNIAHIHGRTVNQLVGKGLVVGLDGTGSADIATRNSAVAMLEQLDQLDYDQSAVTTGNFALVIVTCTLPSVVHVGQPIDVEISALSEASSLRGGRLLPCDLVYFDGAESTVYVTAAGAVSVGGAIQVNAAEAQLTRNNTKTGVILGGGRSVRSLIGPILSESGDLEIALNRPNPTVAVRARDMLADFLGERVRGVDVVDDTLLRIRLSDHYSSDMAKKQAALRIFARIGYEEVLIPDEDKIVVDVASGTVIAGGHIPIGAGTISVSSLTVTVVQEQVVSQPQALSGGETTRLGRSRIDVRNEGPGSSEDAAPITIDGNYTTVTQLLENLRALRLTPYQIALVLEKLAEAKMIHVPVIQR